MRIKSASIALATLCMLGVALTVSSNPGGRAGRTGAPGEGNCTACHTSFALNSGPGSLSLTSSNMTNWEFAPNTTYNLILTVSQANINRFGMGLTALGSNNANYGVLAAGTGTQIQVASGRNNVIHNANGGFSSNAHTFNFTWTSPAAVNPGDQVTFYFTGLAANQNNANSGDHVYSGTQTAAPLTTALSDALVNQTLRTFPAPASDNLHLILPEQPGAFGLEVFNLNGELVYAEENLSSSNTAHIVNTVQWNNGLYVVRVRNASQTWMTKVTVQH
jgi:hypothetical protein